MGIYNLNLKDDEYALLRKTAAADSRTLRGTLIKSLKDYSKKILDEQNEISII